MEEAYFANHGRARQFPFSLYHKPLEKDLLSFLKHAAENIKNPEILIIGGGFLLELQEIPQTARVTLIDIDQRALDAVKEKRDPRIKDYFAVLPNQDLKTLGKTFDVVYAKEVIEHIIDAQVYLSQIYQILRPGGFLWLSTPNYGEPWLAAIEVTFLEWIAKISGYTRKGMHPTRFSSHRLTEMLDIAGFKKVLVRTVSRRLALVAHARK